MKGGIIMNSRKRKNLEMKAKNDPMWFFWYYGYYRIYNLFDKNVNKIKIKQATRKSNIKHFDAFDAHIYVDNRHVATVTYFQTERGNSWHGDFWYCVGMN